MATCSAYSQCVVNPNDPSEGRRGTFAQCLNEVRRLVAALHKVCLLLNMPEYTNPATEIDAILERLNRLVRWSKQFRLAFLRCGDPVQ